MLEHLSYNLRANIFTLPSSFSFSLTRRHVSGIVQQRGICNCPPCLYRLGEAITAVLLLHSMSEAEDNAMELLLPRSTKWRPRKACSLKPGQSGMKLPPPISTTPCRNRGNNKHAVGNRSRMIATSGRKPSLQFLCAAELLSVPVLTLSLSPHRTEERLHMNSS